MNWAIVAAALSALNLIATVVLMKRIDGRFDRVSKRLRALQSKEEWNGVRDAGPSLGRAIPGVP
jgi:hypothetical protein